MRIPTRIAACAASAAVLLVGAVLTAPTASAASIPKGCSPDYGQYMKTTTAVNLRSGPGTKYKSLGILKKGTRFYAVCDKGLKWYWGPVGSGANKGKKGWVSTYYLAPLHP